MVLFNVAAAQATRAAITDLKPFHSAIEAECLFVFATQCQLAAQLLVAPSTIVGFHATGFTLGFSACLALRRRVVYMLGAL
jgi:hypothetical protein